MAENVRNALRAKLLSQRHPKREKAYIDGAEIDIMPLAIDEVFSLQGEENRNRMIAKAIVAYCRVPGSDERVFEEGDIDVILKWPFDKDVQALVNKITGMMDIGAKVDTAVGNSPASTGDSGTSSPSVPNSGSATLKSLN